MRATGPPALLALLALLAGVALGQDCPVKYSRSPASASSWQQAQPDDRPLLFGGVATRCVENCQPREFSVQAKMCEFDPKLGPSSCSMTQIREALVMADTTRAFGEDSDILNMSPCDLLPYLRGRTLWLIGDSHTKRLYWSLQCFLFDFWAEDQAECKLGLNPDDVDALRLSVEDYRQPLSCFHLSGEGGGRVCLVHVALASTLVLEGPTADGSPAGLLPTLRARFARPQDIFYVNVGTHDRKNPTNQALYRPSLERVGTFYQNAAHDWPHLIFRETPALHPMDLIRNTCSPVQGFAPEPRLEMLGGGDASPAASQSALMWQIGAASNSILRSVLPKYGIPVVTLFNATVPLVGHHLGMMPGATEPDCVHYCQPGVYQMWVWALYDLMKRGATGIEPIPLETATAWKWSFQCVEQRSAASLEFEMLMRMQELADSTRPGGASTARPAGV